MFSVRHSNYPHSPLLLLSIWLLLILYLQNYLRSQSEVLLKCNQYHTSCPNYSWPHVLCNSDTTLVVYGDIECGSCMKMFIQSHVCPISSLQYSGDSHSHELGVILPILLVLYAPNSHCMYPVLKEVGVRFMDVSLQAILQHSKEGAKVKYSLWQAVYSIQVKHNPQVLYSLLKSILNIQESYPHYQLINYLFSLYQQVKGILVYNSN